MRRYLILDRDFPETTYSSTEEAIEAPEARVRRIRSRVETALIKGSCVSVIAWNDREAVISLSSGLTLRVFLRDGAVCWALSQSATLHATRPQDLEVVELEFSPDLLDRWDRRSIAERRIGRTVQEIFASEAWVWFYVEGAPILMFSWVQRAEPDGELLYWNDSQ